MRRFYKKIDILQSEKCYQVTLDKSPLKTPLKSILQLPTKKLARKIAQEWSHVETEIIPEKMPLYSLAVTALDRVSPQKRELSTQMQNYIMNDLLCYRESEDTKLQEHQNQHWDPWLSWSNAEFAFNLKIGKGIMPVAQEVRNANLLTHEISRMNIWTFMCFVRVTTLTGSAILALAFIRKQLLPEELFSLSYLDELYQNARWGVDDEAIAKQISVKNELHDLSYFFRLSVR